MAVQGFISVRGKFVFFVVVAVVVILCVADNAVARDSRGSRGKDKAKSKDKDKAKEVMNARFLCSFHSLKCTRFQ